ncbi:MAG: SDR family oxidoreductase [Gaiellales bacterium]
MAGIDGKVTVITGASRGIGEATARRLGADGARLVLGARTAAPLAELGSELEAAGATVAWRATDVASRSDVEALVSLGNERFGPVDVLVNNAGIMPQAPLEAVHVEEWDRMIDVNVKGLLYGVAAVLPDMKRRNAGHIVNLGSVAGHLVFPRAAVYCATKFAVRALTEGLRQEAGPHIRVTLISPGVIATSITETTEHPETRALLEERYEIALPPSTVADAIAFALSQPSEVDVNDIVLRPAAQSH